MPYLRQKPGGPLVRIGAGRAPLLTRPRETTAAGTTTGTTGGTALTLEDGTVLTDETGAALMLDA